MLSLDVMGITFSAGSMISTVMKEGDLKTYVEVHFATFNGISDGLVIPYETKKLSPPSALLSLATTELKVKWTDPWCYGPPETFATRSYTLDSRPTISASPVISDGSASGD